MKILHIGQMIGGLDVYIRNSIIYNRKEGNEYVIVCGDEDKHQPVIRNGEEVKEFHIALYRSLNPLNDLKALWQAIKIVKREKPDVIHCHSAKGGIIGRLAGWITGVRTFYTPHAFSFLCTPSRLKRWVFWTIERLTRFNTYVLACSESEQRMAMTDVHYDASHALVWHNAVPDASLEKGNPVDVTEPFACYIGRPCYQKNTLFLLDVIEKVKDKGCNLKFILLGVGYHSPELDAMKLKLHQLGLEDMIRLEPWISHGDCQELVRKSLFYISTALYEGLPLAVIEAMSNGKAIIASDVVGNCDCVRDGENGYLLPLDAEAYAEKIIQLVNDEKLRIDMERKSRELFLNEFFIENRIASLQEKYEGV
jgi:glycosyltransferase involved in cell wall biosynthesis